MTTSFDRRQLFRYSAALGLLATARGCADRSAASSPAAKVDTERRPLVPPAQGTINVAFLLSDGAVVIDFAGPWEVFQDVRIPGRTAGESPFSIYTVAETTDPIEASGGMRIVPSYTLESAPKPNVIVIPAQSSRSPKVLEWIRAQSKTTDVTMSVCSGAFLLAATGLLAGKRATTFHNSFTKFAMQFPDIALQRGARFVEDGNLATAGGLSSGIDLALRVVERYFGRDVAASTAYDLEYQGEGWKSASSNSIYATAPQPAAGHALCAVCQMEVDPAQAETSVFAGTKYYFCSHADKQTFDASPAQFAAARR